MFNPEAFMQATIDQANDTKVIPCPEGEFHAQAIDVKVSSGTIGKGERTGEPWASLNVTWEIADPNVAAITLRDKTRVRQGVMLDLTSDGNLDMAKGRNIGLGKLRDAVGLNVPGQPFSPTMIIGRAARVAVKHRIDERDGETIQPEVRAAIRA